MRSRTSRLAWLGVACIALGVTPSGVNAVANIGLLKAPLPFSVETHPLQLSSTLFAGSLPLVNASVSYEPTDDTQTTLGDIPFPTGAWWTNLVLDKGASPVSTMPYSVKVNHGKLHVAYPFRVVLPTVIQNGFLSEMVLSAASKAPWQQQVVGFDAFGVGLQFTSPDETAGQFTVHLVRGSPYITTEYKDNVPMIEAMDGIKIQRIKRIDDTMTDMKGQPLTFPVYALQLSSNHLWYVFGSDDSLNLSLSDGIVVANEKFTGVMRVALAVTVDELPYLIESAPVFPVGGQVKYDVDPVKEVATIEFAWKTRTFPSHTDKSTELLMVALPHHNDTLLEGTKVIDDLRYTAIRGIMVGVIGNSWKMEETLPLVEWNYADNKGLFDTTMPDAAKRSEMGKKALEEIVASLKKDIQTYLTLAPDSYGFGKQIGRESRLLIIADALKQQKEFDFELEKIKREMLPWLSAKNGDALIYDERFGGLITTNGFHDQNADFGNGYYNDHHFHYGYFMHALAVLRKYAPDVIEEHATAAAMIAADIGTPLDSTQTKFFGDFPARHYFPTARHKDWFVGHSYASGIFPMEVGKSQESSSECINAYYGLALFGSLDEGASEDPLSYYNYARLLLATEISSTKKYWHMRENSQVYEPIFAKNAMVGVVGEMSVVYSTWFGDRPEYVHGINMIPFTPITTELMNEAYVAREYDQLRYSYDGIESTDIWKSIVVLDHAILDAEAAWEELTNEVAAYDTWNSKTNSLLWIATRPSWFDEKNRTKLTKPNLHDEDKCFGFPGCSTAGANGTALACCASLPGCCPSALGCCPKKDPAELPVNACFGEHKCAVLGLGCCNSIDGCCTPNLVTGEVLGCCKDPTPRSVTPAPSSAKSKTTPAGFCNRQPKCNAMGLLCCDSAEGCCKPDPVTGAQLDCCVPEDEDDVATCHSQPRCAAAGLDCCATANGCCTPDPITGATLDCCDAATPQPTTATPTDDGTCHNEPQCAKAGLDCCLNPDGCCKPDPVTGAKLLCCQGDASAEVSTTSTGTGTSSSDDDSGSTVTRVIAIGLGIVFVVIIAYCLATCYRRRHYAPIEHDTRAWSCAVLMLIVAALFVYLVATA